jgi:signal transduction histidine kinase
MLENCFKSSNLLVNALDALSPDGVVTLRLSKRFGKARLLVADNGCGISDALKEKVFEPFFTTKKDLGTGLGLALTRKIVARHGGSIWVRSRTGPGQSGTAFQISLPI